ncbi:transporter suffix domain-containing protein [Mesorhizobium sp. KR1-2]|uniref:transporter suffix domain-containing protein n=1 Tax=Mesorhizobium sp. KR1-2 TaxID=3156609 RepID=UPI0032B5A68B
MMGMGNIQPRGEAGRGWRFRCGIALFVLAVVLVLMIPLLAALGLQPATLAAITGAVFIINKILLVMVIALVGKAGFQELKNILVSYVPRLHGLGPVGPVGPVRHAIGLVMFWVPLTWSILEPYIDHFWPGIRPNRWEYQLAGDLIFVAGFFVLGGNFWEKVQALFIRTAHVVHTASHAAD